MSENAPQPENLNTAPPQGKMYIPPQYYASQDDEIDLRELFGVLWNGKWWIIGITFLFALASVFYALSLPNEYKATAIVAPASSDSGGSLSKMAGQLGGLASLAGINLGASESNDAVIAMEIMKTWGFQEEFIKNHNLQVAIFAAKGWNQSTNDLVIDDELYDVKQEKWVRDDPKSKSLEPSSWILHKAFNKNLSVSQNSDIGLISIGFTHYSPEYTQKITQWLIEDVNSLMKEKALADASKNIEYLESQIGKTSLSDMQSIFYSLIQEQTKTKMLANVSDEYVFNIVSKAKSPEEKSGPQRAIICILISLMGGLISIFFVFAKNYLRPSQQK